MYRSCSEAQGAQHGPSRETLRAALRFRDAIYCPHGFPRRRGDSVKTAAKIKLVVLFVGYEQWSGGGAGRLDCGQLSEIEKGRSNRREERPVCSAIIICMQPVVLWLGLHLNFSRRYLSKANV
jgi:hypothetical protein